MDDPSFEEKLGSFVDEIQEQAKQIGALPTDEIGKRCVRWLAEEDRNMAFSCALVFTRRDPGSFKRLVADLKDSE